MTDFVVTNAQLLDAAAGQLRPGASVRVEGLRRGGREVPDVRFVAEWENDTPCHQVVMVNLMFRQLC